MRVLLDTNVLIDYLTEREPFFDSAYKILMDCKSGKLDGIIAAHSIADIFYILRKYYTNKERREMLLAFCDIFRVEGIDEYKIKAALKNESFTDFEDCLQLECARSAQVDYIVTRNVKDFEQSNIPVLSPDELLCKINMK